MEKKTSKGIINKLEESSYIKWIDPFVETVLEKSNISYKEAIIEDIEINKRIYLIIDGTKYTIRTWDYSVTKTDANNKPCAELVDYTLYKQMEGDDGIYNKDIFEGSEEIEWTN